MAKKIWTNLFYYSLLLIAFTMPMQKLVCSFGILMLFIAWIAKGGFSEKIKRISSSPSLMLFLLFYFLHIAGMIYTENSKEGLFILQKKLPLFFLPLIIGTSTISQKQLDVVYKFFVAACAIAAMICLSYGLYKYFAFNDTTYLYFEDLTYLIDFHFVYFSMYLAFCIFILTYFIYRDREKISTSRKRLGFSLIAFFFSFMILSTARTPLVAMIAILLLTVLILFFKKGKMIQGALIISILLAGVVFSLNQFSFLKERFTKIIESDWSAPPNDENANGLTLRIAKWKCTLEGIREHPWIGKGTGDTQDFLQACYIKDDFWGYHYYYNSHNQFLQVCLALGVVGLLVFLLSFSVPFINFIKRKNILAFSFILLCLACFLTESILERQNGIVFYSFFLSLFAFFKEK